MSKTYVKKKIPWLKIAMVLLIIGIGIYALSMAVPALGGAIIGGFVAIGVGIYMFFIGAPTWLSVVSAVSITVVLFVLVTQRKYFFKQKVLDTSAAMSAGVPLQGSLIQPNAFSSMPGIGQSVMPSKDTEVTTSQ
jgi:hypothetical protein